MRQGSFVADLNLAMRTSLKLFILGIVRRGWFLFFGLPSGAIGVLSLYAPNSVLENTIVDVLPTIGGSLLLLSILYGAFMTFHELRISLPVSRYDPEVAERIHALVQKGRQLTERVRTEASARLWVQTVERLLREHMPSELRMFQTTGQRRMMFVRTDSTRVPLEELRAKAEKLRLIMGRYEQRQEN